MDIENKIRKDSEDQSDFWDQFSHATGKIDYTLTNDYMFRALLQRRGNVLKGLVAALLHLDLEQIRECTITNPIELGKAIGDKDYILDIRLLLNDDKILNLEMQKLNEKNWPERSISYTCRAFDQLQKGQDYEEVLPVINIGFLDFTLFPEVPEFYARNLLMNVKNHHIYSRKLDIRVVDLKQIELATEEDRRYGIDRWARLFKSTTWEGIRMIAEKDSAMQEATKELYVMNADELIRQQAQARADYEFYQRQKERKLKRAQEELESARKEIGRQKKELGRQQEEIEALKAALNEANEKLASKSKS